MTASVLSRVKTGDKSSYNKALSSEFTARFARTRQSTLWAAYGDALGWISELTDPKGLMRRTGGVPLRSPIGWTRRIGGRSGVITSLPPGCYSDDTQLRLATSRAIGSDGFDVEAFAKIELPVWLSYGLGGGKSTSAAAVNLTRRTVPWFANTFKGWTNSGGNGAAMRIQPHVWASSDLDNPDSFLPDVIRNSICTHSHPVGLLGSVIHALSLAHTMGTGNLPSLDDLLNATKFATRLPEIILKDAEVGSYWRGALERESGGFEEAWKRTIDECMEAIIVAGKSVSSANSADRYSALVNRLNLRDPAQRGSGLLTAIASVGLLWCETDPEKAMLLAANEVGTDTDTIASMAGALVGIIAETEPPHEVLDASLFRSEAKRLTRIACGERMEILRYPYPDLLHWSPPRKRAETLVRTRNGDLLVHGLGPAQFMSEAGSAPRGDFKWQWVKLDSGQSLLIKSRASIVCMDDKNWTMFGQDSRHPTSIRGHTQLPPVVDHQTKPKIPVGPTRSQHPQTFSNRVPSLDLQRALDYVVENKHNDKALGGALRRVVGKGTQGQIAAFTTFLIDELCKTEKSRTEHGG